MTRKRLSRVSVFAAVLMVIGLTAGAQTELPPGGTFVDDDGNVHEGYIEAIAAEGITRGCNPPENNWYCPDQPITRGEMAAFLVRSLGLGGPTDDHFTDDDGSVFENDINALAEAGITRGCNPPDNDRFCPDETVTRGQMAAFLVRGFGYTDPGEGDLFVDDDASTFEGDIDRLATAGVTRGCNPPDNDRFCPEEPVRRDQMASFLGRALELRPRQVPPTMAVEPYFFLDEEGHPNRSGPFVAPLHRRVAETVATAEASMEALLSGPTGDEANSVPAVLTYIPEGTELLSIDIDGDTATVDLSAEFSAEENSEEAARRAAQVVFTLTRFDTIGSVQFRQEGVAVEVRTDNGATVTGPVDRDDYLDYQASISVEDPAYGAPVDDPLRVAGMAAVFEATFQYALTDADGVIIEEGTAMSTSGVGWAPFDFTIDYEVDGPQRGSLIVWTESAQDGSRIDIREYPVFLDQ